MTYEDLRKELQYHVGKFGKDMASSHGLDISTVLGVCIDKVIADKAGLHVEQEYLKARVRELEDALQFMIEYSPIAMADPKDDEVYQRLKSKARELVERAVTHAD